MFLFVQACVRPMSYFCRSKNTTLCSMRVSYPQVAHGVTDRRIKIKLGQNQVSTVGAENAIREHQAGISPAQ